MATYGQKKQNSFISPNDVSVNQYNQMAADPLMGSNGGLLDLMSTGLGASKFASSGNTDVGGSTSIDIGGSSSQLSPADKRAAINAGFAGAKAGGLGQGLLQGGIASGNPYVAGGGLLLSIIEANKQRKAEEEAAKIAAENQRTQSMRTQLNQLMNMKLGV